MTREEAIKELSYIADEMPSMECADWKEAIYMAIKALEQTGWISVNERLPKKGESVLLTICANDSLYGFNENFVKVMCGSYSPHEDERDWIVDEVRYYIDNVIAWMPLPKPYEKGVQE